LSEFVGRSTTVQEIFAFEELRPARPHQFRIGWVRLHIIDDCPPLSGRSWAVDFILKKNLKK
jgi:hypothetical protein